MPRTFEVKGDDKGQETISVDPVTAKDKLNLAKNVLLWLVLLVLFFAVVKIFKPTEEAKAVFDAVTQAAIPIGSLILGYYFGTSDD